MDVDRYLSRIGLDDVYTRSRGVAAVARLQEAHVQSVPFENLSIVGDPQGAYSGEGISLAIMDLYGKIVDRERGGLCFELNGLFGWLLEELGFDVTRLAGRTFVGPDGELGKFASHHTLLVALKDPYLVDVGFGDIIRRPLALDGTLTCTVDGDWRVVGSDREEADHEVQFRAPGDDAWEPRYVFTEVSREMIYFEEPRVYHESNPDAPFTGDPVISMATDCGRKTLARESLTITEDGERRKQAVAPTEWQEVLEWEFGVVLSGV